MDIDVKNVAITCKNCKGISRIKIIGKDKVMYVDHTPIIACRLRPDMKWGFECQCGNDTRLAPEEKKDVAVLVSGSSQSVIDRILKTITIKPETKFKMETI